MSVATAKKTLSDLPRYLTNIWLLDATRGKEAKADFIREKWTLSSLVEVFLEAQMDTYLAHTTDPLGIPTSLVHLSIGKIIQLLEESDNVDVDIRTIIKNLDDLNLRQLLTDVRLPYVMLRLFLNIIPTIPGKESTLSILNLDIDISILRSEQYVRHQCSSLPGRHSQIGLVTIDEVSGFLGNQPTYLKETLFLQRKDPSPGGLEFLDEHRKRNIELLASSNVFAKTFDRITKGILTGLDWNNVFVAGGIALTTLMHTNTQKDNERSVRDPDIDIYLYGLNAEQANDKVEHIYNVWRGNLPIDNKEQLVIKNAKTITFLADYPNRRIQIILKLLSSPTQVLLNFDLDICAVGWNGLRAIMLPRCARAIETGYSIFTMDLVWGHYLGNRRATREARVFKYADRGFGLRILPGYIRSLESRHISDDTVTIDDSSSSEHGSEKYNYRGDTGQTQAPPRDKYETLDQYRKPEGFEPGLKTLRRIAYIGQDFTNRFCFGPTPLACIPEENFDGDWDTDYSTRTMKWKTAGKKVSQTLANGGFYYGPLIRLSSRDTDTRHGGNSNGEGSLNQFELFMRHCEAWRLDAKHEVVLDRTDPIPNSYSDDAYDVMPQYDWNEGFDMKELIGQINHENDSLFRNLKTAISVKLNMPFQQVGYSNYLTRRIRRQVYGPDLESVMSKQISLPIIIPYELESRLQDHIIPSFPDVPSGDKLLLIPVHDPSKYNTTAAIIPSLQDTPSEAGNLRYWILSNQSMWACQHRIIDEIFEVMNSLFHWFRHDTSSRNHGYSTAHKEAIACIAKAFRRRIILPDVPTNIPQGASLSQTEAKLFRAWAFAVPHAMYGNLAEDLDDRDVEFDEYAYMYPVPEELFWKDEGKERMYV